MRLAVLVLALLVAHSPVHADSRQDYTVEVQGDRSRSNVITIAGIAGAGVLFGGLGVYYNLDSRDAANAVSASKFINVPWTQDRQDTYDRAHDSKIKAEVFYGIGGACLIAAVVTLIVTEPKTETITIRPHAAPTVAPAPGGAMLGGMWSF